MTVNAVNDPKVRFEWGEGGGPVAQQTRMQDLFNKYCTRREELADMEFNAELLDLQPPRVVNHPLPQNNEEAVQALVKNGGVNKAGSMFCVGVYVANSRVALETLWWTKELAEKAKEEKERAHKISEDGRLKSGIDAFRKWYVDGNKVDGDGNKHPIMSRTCAVAIVKVPMPKVAPLSKLN